MQYLEIVIIYLIRIISRLIYIFPVKKNRVVFISYKGKQFSCNPKYIFKYMIERYGRRYKYIWCLNNGDLLPDGYKKTGIKTAKYLSPKYIYYVMTAGFIINNSGGLDVCFPARKGQMIVNTWHGGGAYKTLTIDSKDYIKRVKSSRVKQDLRGKMIFYIISSCEKFTYFTSKDFRCPENRFLPLGMPRNDIFFSETDFIKNKVFNYYNLAKNEKIVLYAPTYRRDIRKPGNIDFSIETEKLLKTLDARFGIAFKFFYRLHYAFGVKKDEGNYNIISASDYPDMQELLCAADVLITDYSSSVWDFSFTYKPCFLYAPDIEEYKSSKNFYTPIEEWPFPLAETNQELLENIKNFDDAEYIKNVKKHHKNLGSYETGHATEQFCNLLFE
jgi:CDP-glycerol glycerophosphotransferase